jgi:aminopeptidase N
MLKFIIIFLLLAQVIFAQSKHHFTAADTLRGALRPERTCYDVTFYDLNIDIDLKNKQIKGFNDLIFKATTDFSRLQIDLFENMQLTKITLGEENLTFERTYNAVFVNLPPQKKGNTNKIRIFYEGTPIAAKNAPWDGGFSWKKDANGNDWAAVSCEGIGASLWYPCKDHLSDEPDSMGIHVTVPDTLQCISNGNLRSTKAILDGKKQYNWYVSYPINNYNVTLNIGKYTHFSDIYTAKDGAKLNLDYYVMPYNLEKARKQFEQVKPMLAAYEYYFGKYPFWRDGYALVETPYLGMEHQSAIAYGNQYMRGYLGRLIPQDMNFDYIIIHESGHEYFGNSVSCADHAEMWLHESFTTYMEALYVEYTMSKADAVRYLNTQRAYIENKDPILAPKNVNFDDWDDSDQYYKGAMMLHTLRSIINNDRLWFDILKTFYQKQAYKTTYTEDFTRHVNAKTKRNFAPFFKQYLETIKTPTLEYNLRQCGKKLILSYKWAENTTIAGFNMPIHIGKINHLKPIQPTNEWQHIRLKRIQLADFLIDVPNFLIDTKENTTDFDCKTDVKLGKTVWFW